MTVTVGAHQCAVCGCCVGLCPVGALSLDETRLIIGDTCTECGLCVPACPMGALGLGGPSAQFGAEVRHASYDIVVVGAGPAGSMSAWAAAEQGLRVLLLEKRQEIGSPVRCAEGVGRVYLEQFVDPDPRWTATAVDKAEITLLADSGTIHVMAEGGSGLILERRVFDRFLAESAAAAGADVLVRSPVLGLLRDQSRVVGVLARVAGHEREIPASIVIGADGVESWVGRWAGLTRSLSARDHMTCAQYLLSGLEMDPTCIRYWISSRDAPGGYLWAFPKGNGRANVGLGMRADLAQHPPIVALDRFIDSCPELSRGSPVTLIAGGVPLAPVPDRLVADGIMLVGDTARQVDPLTGGGIIPAMTAGRLAGRVAAEAIQEGTSDANRLLAYHREFDRVLGRNLGRNYRLYERFPPDQRASRGFLRVFAAATAGH